MQSALSTQLHLTQQDIIKSEKEGGMERPNTSRPIPTAIPAFLTRPPVSPPPLHTSVECNSLAAEVTATPSNSAANCDDGSTNSNHEESPTEIANTIINTNTDTESEPSQPDNPSVDPNASSLQVHQNSAQQPALELRVDYESKPDQNGVEKVANGDSNNLDTDVDPASLDESSDSLHHALTKTALCSALFSLTRARKLPLQQANQLSKILCSNNQCLAEFEQVHAAMESLEKSGDRAHEEWLARKAEATLIDTETYTPTDASLLLPSGSPQKSAPSVSPTYPDASPPRNRKKGFWSGLVGGGSKSPSHARTPSKSAAAASSPITGSPISHVSTPPRPSPLLAPPTPRTPHTPISPIPSESPRIMYHKQAEELMWNWIQIQMEQLQFSAAAGSGTAAVDTASTVASGTSSATSTTGLRSASHSHSTPNLQQLASSASFAVTSSSSTSSSTLRPPVLVSIPPRAPGSSATDVYSRASLITGSPQTPGQSLPSSISFNSALRPPASSVPNTPSGGSRYSPARIWKSIFGGGHSTVHVGNGSYSTHPNLSPLMTSPSTNPHHHASTSAGTTIATEAFAQHFDSFPRIDDTMLSVVHAQLPPSAILWLNGAASALLNDEGQSSLGSGGLKCHSSLPFPAIYPLNVLPLHDNGSSNSSNSASQQQQMEADLLDAPLPPRSPSHSHHSSTSSSESTNLLTAAHLPVVVSQPPQLLRAEQAHLDTWSDLLLNYRKHISKRLGMAPPLVLWNWWHAQWVKEQVEIDARTALKIDAQQPETATSSDGEGDEGSEPRFHDDEGEDSHPPPRDVQAIPFRLPEGNDSPPLSPRLTSCKSETLPPPRALSSTHLRLLLLLLQWVSLTPFDLRQCAPAKEKVLEFLRTLLVFPPPLPNSNDDAPAAAASASSVGVVVARWMELAKSIQTVLENAEEEDPSGMGAYIDHLTHDGETTSPLQLVPFPFSEEVDRVYSSRLFTYPPFQLARELTLHSFELLRKIPLREWMDGAWQQKKASAFPSSGLNGRSQSHGGIGGPAGHKVSTSSTGDEDEAYSNAYSIASASMSPFTETNFSSAPSTPMPSTPAPTPNPNFASSVGSTSSCTKHFIADFNRLVYWICTEILHPSLRASQRFDLVLYFLEVAMISLKVFRNFHVAFAVSAAFSTQPLYRLQEIQELSRNELKYHAPTHQLQKAMEGELTPTAAGSNVSTPAAASAGAAGEGSETPLASPDPAAGVKKKSQISSKSVKQQYEELKQVTSSRNNYAFYRSMLSSLLASDSQQSSSLFSAHGAPPPLSWIESNTPSGACSVRQSRTSSMDSTYSLQTPLATDGIPLSPTAFAAHSIQRANSTGEASDNGLPTSTSSSSLDALTYLHQTHRHNSSSNSLNGAANEPPSVSFIPHLAVHLKDLTYSQELSGVEQQWVEEQADIMQQGGSGIKSGPTLPAASGLAVSHTFSPMASPKVSSPQPQHRETYSLTAFDPTAARHSSDSSAPLPSAFSCRFDRSRWSRTSKLIFHLLRFQSLPIYTVHLPNHIPPLYTLLQVHLLTHVLPEPELLNMSLEICPRVDKNKLKQATQQKKALTALREEGFL